MCECECECERNCVPRYCKSMGTLLLLSVIRNTLLPPTGIHCHHPQAYAATTHRHTQPLSVTSSHPQLGARTQELILAYHCTTQEDPLLSPSIEHTELAQKEQDAHHGDASNYNVKLHNIRQGKLATTHAATHNCASRGQARHHSTSSAPSYSSTTSDFSLSSPAC